MTSTTVVKQTKLIQFNGHCDTPSTLTAVTRPICQREAREGWLLISTKPDTYGMWMNFERKRAVTV